MRNRRRGQSVVLWLASRCSPTHGCAPWVLGTLVDFWGAFLQFHALRNGSLERDLYW